MSGRRQKRRSRCHARSDQHPAGQERTTRRRRLLPASIAVSTAEGHRGVRRAAGRSDRSRSTTKTCGRTRSSTATPRPSQPVTAARSTGTRPRRRRARPSVDDLRPASRPAARRQQPGHHLARALASPPRRGAEGRRHRRAPRVHCEPTRPGSQRKEHDADEPRRENSAAIADEHLDAAARRSPDQVGHRRARPRPVAWEAFRLANSAMWNQRARSSGFAPASRHPSPDAGGQPRMATVPARVHPAVPRGLVDRAHHGPRDRRPAVVPDRRRQDRGLPRADRVHRLPPAHSDNETGDGVTVLMRYTLRLLTIQQFDRAAAADLLLRADPTRNDPRSASAESRSGSGSARRDTPTRSTRRGTRSTGSETSRTSTRKPRPAHACPWCGATLDRLAVRDHRPSRDDA